MFLFRRSACITMSSGNQQLLCEKCGTRPAVAVFCNSSPGVSEHLCDEFLATGDPMSAIIFGEMKAAQCDFCEAQACSGGTDIFPLSADDPQRYGWLCMSCAMEYHSHMTSVFTDLAALHPTPARQVQRLHEIENKVGRHMREFVRMRDN